jgi:hypothetical protein
MKRTPPPNQLTLDDYLAQHKWCKNPRHIHRKDCRCGRTPQDFSDLEEKIMSVMHYQASGRIPVSPVWISIQLLIDFNIDLTERTIRNHMHRMADSGKVARAGYRAGYRLASIAN